MKKKLLILFLPVVMLMGCDQRSPEERSLDNIKRFYKGNATNRLYCFYIGDIQFPYTQVTQQPIKDNRFNIWLNNERSRRLELFAQLELLQKEVSADGIDYSLTDVGQSAFNYDRFCFGSIDIQEYSLDKKAYGEAIIKYKITNIPDWANSQLFQNYFYQHHKQANGIGEYSELNDDLKEAHISVKENEDKEYEVSVFSSPHLSSSLVYNIEHPEKSRITSREAFAYYDLDLAKKLFSDSLKQGKALTYWGDVDPIVFENSATPEYIAMANMMFLFSGDEAQFISPNKIELTQGHIFISDNYSSAKMKGDFQFYFDKNGNVNRYNFSAQTSDSGASIDVELVKEKQVDLNDGLPVWIYSIDSKIRASWLSNEQLFIMKYKMDPVGQITSITSEQDPNMNSSFTPLYDNKNRLIQFGDTKLIYKNDRLIERGDGQHKTSFLYNKKGQLNQAIDYIMMKNGQYKKDSTCLYSEYNEKGDWTATKCDGQPKLYRKISYYDDK